MRIFKKTIKFYQTVYKFILKIPNKKDIWKKTLPKLAVTLKNVKILSLFCYSSCYLISFSYYLYFCKINSSIKIIIDLLSNVIFISKFNFENYFLKLKHPYYLTETRQYEYIFCFIVFGFYKSKCVL